MFNHSLTASVGNVRQDRQRQSPGKEESVPVAVLKGTKTRTYWLARHERTTSRASVATTCYVEWLMTTRWMQAQAPISLIAERDSTRRSTRVQAPPYQCPSRRAEARAATLRGLIDKDREPRRLGTQRPPDRQQGCQYTAGRQWQRSSRWRRRRHSCRRRRERHPLAGGAGADTLQGGAGTDTASYGPTTAAVRDRWRPAAAGAATAKATRWPGSRPDGVGTRTTAPAGNASTGTRLRRRRGRHAGRR